MAQKQLTIYILLSTIPLLLSAQEHEQQATPNPFLEPEAFDPDDSFLFQMKKPKIIVKGHVVCDQCGTGKIGNTTLPLHDAEVGIKCTDLYGLVTFSGVGYSDTHGVFTIPMDEIPPILGIRACKAKLLRGPNSTPLSCDVVSSMGDGHTGAPLQLVHKSLSEVLFTSGPFACRPSKLPHLCSPPPPHISYPPPPSVPRFHAHTPPPVHPPPAPPLAPPPARYKYKSPPPPAPALQHPHPPPPLQPPKIVTPAKSPTPSVEHHHPPPPHAPPPLYKSPSPGVEHHHPPTAPVPPPTAPVPHPPAPQRHAPPPVYKYASPPPPAFGVKRGKTTVDPTSLPDNDMND